MAGKRNKRKTAQCFKCNAVKMRINQKVIARALSYSRPEILHTYLSMHYIFMHINKDRIIVEDFPPHQSLMRPKNFIQFIQNTFDTNKAALHL